MRTHNDCLHFNRVVDACKYLSPAPRPKWMERDRVQSYPLPPGDDASDCPCFAARVTKPESGDGRVDAG